MPQARFWMAMAMPQASRVRPRSAVIGRVNRPKLVRMPLPMAAMMQPADDQQQSAATAMERGAAMTDMAANSRITGYPCGYTSTAASRNAFRDGLITRI